MEHWYALQAKPHREFVVHRSLGQVEGVRTYLPVLHVEPVNPRARKVRPFFPGYLFVQADLEQVGLSTICWLPGVARVVGCGDQPVAIPDHIVEEIRRRVAEVQEQNPLGEEVFRPGDRVRITKGPFEGYEGMFDGRLNGRMRARILVEFLGRLTTAEVDSLHLEKVSRRTLDR
jgi:transcription elongation factor/antiterminator RfaH